MSNSNITPVPQQPPGRTPRATPKSTDEARKVLNRFSARLDRISGYSLLKIARVSLSVKIEGDAPVKVERNHPTNEQIDAVLLNLRFFILGNEPTAFHRLEESYSLLPISAAIRTDIDAAFIHWNDWKNEPSIVGGNSNIQLFNTIIYGDIVHQNEKVPVDTYEEWSRNDQLLGFAMTGLHTRMISIYNFAVRFEDIHKRILAP